MRVILDTNVFVSGVFFGGLPARILGAWRDARIQPVLSAEILEEYQRVGQILGGQYPGVDLEPFLALLAVHAEIVEAPTLPQPVSADPDDDKFLDDRNSAPIRPDAVLVRGQIGEPEGHSRTLAIKPLASETERVSLYSAVLPAANLAVTALRFQAHDPAFSRLVRVYERVFFRDEVFRRLVAEGRLARAPGSGGGDIDLPVAGVAGRSLDIEIENGDSPALSGLRVTALAPDRTLRFLVPEGTRLRLLYGSPGARAPQYDLGRAFEGGIPAAAAEATLGPPLAGDVAASPVSAPPRAPLIGSEQWTSRRPITLPTAAGVAYLDFYDLPRGVADLRIVDADNRQVPYLVGDPDRLRFHSRGTPLPDVRQLAGSPADLRPRHARGRHPGVAGRRGPIGGNGEDPPVPHTGRPMVLDGDRDRGTAARLPARPDAQEDGIAEHRHPPVSRSTGSTPASGTPRGACGR